MSLTTIANSELTGEELADLNLDTIGADFDRDGFVVVRNLFSQDQMQEVFDECDRLLEQSQLIDMNNLNLRTRITQAKETIGETKKGQYQIERFDPVQDISQVFYGVCNHPKLKAVVGAALKDEPLLFKDKLIYKLPGTHGYAMHQDSHQWEPFPVEDIVSVMLAIDSADSSNGALEVFPDYHKWLQVNKNAMGSHYRSLQERVDPAKAHLVETNPGDVIVFHSRTPHQSGDNTSDKSRRQYYPTYSAAKQGNLYMGHYDHVHQLRRSERPGERLYLR